MSSKDGLTENAGHEIAGQNIDDSVDTRSAETRVATRHKCDARADTPRSSCLQLLPVWLLTWKSSQSLQQVSDAVAGGRSSASSLSLVDTLWCHID